MKEDIELRLTGLKNKLKRVKTSYRNENIKSYKRKLFGEKERLEEEITFLECLLEKY